MGNKFLNTSQRTKYTYMYVCIHTRDWTKIVLLVKLIADSIILINVYRMMYAQAHMYVCMYRIKYWKTLKTALTITNN